ncbi:MAG: MaoC family dehydratase [Candidatus Andersenbacteria bacterium]|nr:MaoC family dehydratase [Candidatus Andersenbacteria bacterium]
MALPSRIKTRPAAADLAFADIRTGATYTFTRTVTEQDVAAFAALTGDYNPLHMQDGVAHGLLVGSLFSRLVGMLCPGRYSLYLSQTLQWRRPVQCGQKVQVQGTVAATHASVRVVRLKTRVLVGGQVAVDGEARVRVLR